MLKIEILKPESELTDSDKQRILEVEALLKEISSISSSSNDDDSWILEVEKRMFLGNK